jgi:hypothetical protein
MSAPALESEIGSQPDCWAAAALADRYRGVLPPPGERVAVIGCGTSRYIAGGYTWLRESRGQGVTDAWPASQAPLTWAWTRASHATSSGQQS